MARPRFNVGDVVSKQEHERNQQVYFNQFK